MRYLTLTYLDFGNSCLKKQSAETTLQETFAGLRLRDWILAHFPFTRENNKSTERSIEAAGCGRDFKSFKCFEAP